MTAHEAQAATLGVQQAIDKLELAASVLTQVAERLRGPKAGHAGRQVVRQLLSGVLADVETVRVAIKA